MNPTVASVQQRLRTPRAAAVAGILFSVMFIAAMLLIRLALPEGLTASGQGELLKANSLPLSAALMLVPFAGIAFLWFLGVVRAHLGGLEDQFFSTVLVGSGLLFIVMVFVAMAIAGGLLAGDAATADQLAAGGVVIFGQGMMYIILNVYAIRMAGVFMISLGTIWFQSRAVPRLLVFVTYGLALLLLLAVNFSQWLILIFPVWVLGISVYILRISLSDDAAPAEGIVGSHDAP